MAWELIMLPIYLVGMMVIGLMTLWVEEGTPGVLSEENSADSPTETNTEKKAA